MGANIFMDGIRNFFALLDRAIYGLISVVYEILLTLSKISIFSSSDIKQFSTRVYTLLGIIMLFKVTFSLISYLVNPDALSDKTTGAGSLIKNIFITLVLIITVPFAFDLLYRAQSAIIKDDLIARFILGTTGETTEELSVNMNHELCGEKTADVDGVGDYLSVVAIRPFIQPYEEHIDKLNGDKKDNASTYCGESNVETILVSDVYNVDSGLFGEYLFNYKLGLSTAAGVFLLLLLINFCFEIAVRSIKLGFLEIIAPIPIISYIDPKSSKSGMFKKWTDEVIKTWASLFIRLAALFFAIYTVQIIGTRLDDGLLDNGIWINLFLIFGALMFAKQAPKLIEDILGIKMGNGLELNPLKKISNDALGGKTILKGTQKGLGLIGGAGLATAGTIIANNRKKQELKDAMAARDKAENRFIAARTNYQNLRNIKRSGGSVSMSQYTEAAKEFKESALAQKAARNKVTDEQAKYDEKYGKYFSGKHPIASGVLDTVRGAKNGFTSVKGDQLTVGKIVADVVDGSSKGAKQAADTRNANDKRPISVRAEDFITDIAGIKNSSGTTSLISKELKELQQKLDKINTSLSGFNDALARLDPNGYDFDSNRNPVINPNYNGPDKEQISGIIGHIDKALADKVATEKAIKENEEIQKLSKKD